MLFLFPLEPWQKQSEKEMNSIHDDIATIRTLLRIFPPDTDLEAVSILERILVSHESLEKGIEQLLVSERGNEAALKIERKLVKELEAKVARYEKDLIEVDKVMGFILNRDHTRGYPTPKEWAETVEMVLMARKELEGK